MAALVGLMFVVVFVSPLAFAFEHSKNIDSTKAHRSLAAATGRVSLVRFVDLTGGDYLGNL